MKNETERNMAEIQLVALMLAIDGFCQTKPDMNIVELKRLLPTILKFAREAELDSINKE